MEALRNTFGRQAIPMTWDFAEGNPFSESSGNWMINTEWGAKSIRMLPARKKGFSCQDDASRQKISMGKIVSTHPPCYYNIPYADLSDFFYVWLRRSLKFVYPELFATLAVPKAEELVAFAYRHDGKSGAEDFFLNGMTNAMQCIAGQSHTAFPVTIYYAFKQSETKGKGATGTGGGELLGLDAQLPEGAGTLQRAGRTGGLGKSREERSGVGSENSHGDLNGNEEQEEWGGGCHSGGEGLPRKGRRHFHHHHRNRRAGRAAAGLLHQRGRAGPTGEGDHQHRGAERWGGVGLGLHQGLLEQTPIADGPSTAAITAPISGERLDAPAELVGSAADGAIGATGTAMEQQMNGPATTALEQGRGDARLRPDEITTTASDDDDRAMGQRRRRQEARKRQCSGLGHCSRGQAHGLQSK